jgi:methyl-accepting chemotaxis protein
LSDEVATPAIEAASGSGSGSAGSGPPAAVYRRRLSNYLLDKRLQLRYVIVVSLLSAIICGVLGTLIYRQEQQASTFLEEDLQELTAGDASLREFQAEVARDMESRDRALVVKMIGAGFGLVLILSIYLVVMTHKVAGPLYKVSMYFDRMSSGRFTAVTPLRRGDMLQDFFSSFQTTKDAIRKRMDADLVVMERACKAARNANVSGALADEVAKLEKHLKERRDKLV